MSEVNSERSTSSLVLNFSGICSSGTESSSSVNSERSTDSVSPSEIFLCSVFSGFLSSSILERIFSSSL